MITSVSFNAGAGTASSFEWLLLAPRVDRPKLLNTNDNVAGASLVSYDCSIFI